MRSALKWLLIGVVPFLLLSLMGNGAAPPPEILSLTIAPDTILSLAFIGPTINATYGTAELTGVVNSLIGVVNGLRARFFNLEKVSDSEIIAFDVDKKRRYAAPYVHPRSPGKPRNIREYQTDTFKPAYIKLLTQVDPDAPLKRIRGEALLGEFSPEDRLDAIVTQELQDHREEIDRNLERQALEGLMTGAVTIAGVDYPAVTVTFGRASALQVAANTLTTTALWSASATADPAKNFRAWSRKAVKESGSVLRHFIMDSDAYDAFRGVAKVKDDFDVRRIDGGSLNTNEAQTEGLILRGEYDGHLIYTYDGWFTDAEGVDQVAMSSGTVLGVGAIDGIVHYGAIKDFKARMKALPIFAKAWEEENPSGLQLLTQSAPLVVPQRINASLCALVL